MAERIDGVLAELLAAQENSEPMPATPNTESAPQGGEGELADPTASEEAAEASVEAAENGGEGNAPEAPGTAEEGNGESGEVPPTPTPPQPINELAKITEEIGNLRRQNAQLQAMMMQMQKAAVQTQNAQKEANQRNEEAVASAILEPPVLDFEQVQYLGDAERQKALSSYGTAVAEYTKASLMKELQPIVDQYHRQTKEAADTAVKHQMAGSGRFEGFTEDAEQIEKIIATTPGLSDLPPETKYALGYVINRGVKAMNAKPAAPETAEELVAKVLNNPEAMKAIEKQRAAKIAAAGKGAPTLGASQGQSSAPAVAQNPPQTLSEARERAFKMFGRN